ncbi:MAG: hypothetical protein BYD32DRAFT_463302 [Podila humilis]|nr:MAG: hypothetical protein BYD32DRAFT_463302 [Podila humilis]
MSTLPTSSYFSPFLTVGANAVSARWLVSFIAGRDLKNGFSNFFNRARQPNMIMWWPVSDASICLSKRVTLIRRSLRVDSHLQDRCFSLRDFSNSSSIPRSEDPMMICTNMAGKCLSMMVL